LPDPFGFLNINKPSGMTSHDVVAKIRRALKIKKIGHAGTLDPLATGVLVLCLGKATRLSEYAMSSIKRYRARVFLGAVTDTYDAEGEVQEQIAASHLTRNDVENALLTFVGDIEQLPPIYSAIKQGGKKLYELARAGETVERSLRPVTIRQIKLIEWSPPEFVIDVVCSSGTYIRSLAFDIGQFLGVGAYLSGLVRTASGQFQVENAVSLEAILTDENWRSQLIPADSVVAGYPALYLDAAATTDVICGRPIEIVEPLDMDLGRAYNSDGEFIALVRRVSGHLQPHKVFVSFDK
jgi:tRNA pseudouridine55 synthase